MNYTVDELKNIVAEAKSAAKTAAEDYVAKWTQDTGGNAYGEPMYCGFAWVNIYDVKGNTRAGKALKAAGVRQDYTRAFQLYNPSDWPGQSMDVKEAGASAAAGVLKRYGFTAYMGSRAD
jgi:hypothetical protein